LFMVTTPWTAGGPRCPPEVESTTVSAGLQLAGRRCSAAATRRSACAAHTRKHGSSSKCVRGRIGPPFSEGEEVATKLLESRRAATGRNQREPSLRAGAIGSVPARAFPSALARLSGGGPPHLQSSRSIPRSGEAPGLGRGARCPSASRSPSRSEFRLGTELERNAQHVLNKWLAPGFLHRRQDPGR